MKRSELLFTFLLVPIDVLAILTAFTLGYFTRVQGDIVYIWVFADYFRFVLSLVFFWIVIFSLEGLYKKNILKSGALDELASVFLGVSSGIMLVVAYFFLSRTEFFSRLVILYSWVYAVILIFVARQIIKGVYHILLKHGIGIHRVIIVGKNNFNKEIIAAISQSKYAGMKVVKIIDRDGIEKIESILAQTKFDEIILADPSISEKEALVLIDICQQRGKVIKLVPNIFRVRATNIAMETISGVPLVEFKRTPLDGWGTIIKRIIDIVLSIILLIILSPLLLIISLIIKLTSPGEVLFRQKRVGLHGEFWFLKFRSMVKDAQLQHEQLINEHGNMFKLKDDPRVTPFGLFLRKTSLDELPQLWNVLRGEMSLVGPRPAMPEEVKRYQPWEKQRLGIKPGITGLWQVSGRSELDFTEWVRLDVYYIENWSFWLDIKILLKTIWVVFRRRGAY